MLAYFFTQPPEIKLVAGEYCLLAYIQQVPSAMLQQIGFVQFPHM